MSTGSLDAVLSLSPTSCKKVLSFAYVLMVLVVSFTGQTWVRRTTMRHFYELGKMQFVDGALFGNANLLQEHVEHKVGGVDHTQGTQVGVSKVELSTNVNEVIKGIKVFRNDQVYVFTQCNEDCDKCRSPHLLKKLASLGNQEIASLEFRTR